MLNRKPETNGVMMAPRSPVSPATPIAATMTATATARNGPMNGTQATAAAMARPSAARTAAVVGPNCSSGTPTITTSTSQVGPDKWASSVKSLVNVTVSEKLNGTLTVGQLRQIFGVQMPKRQTRGRQKCGRKLFKSTEN